MGKRINKTKEQLVKEAENKKIVEHKKDIIVNKFYPALVGATISVEEAKSLIQAMGSLIMEEGLKAMRLRKFDEVAPSIFKVLCADSQREQEIEKLLSTLYGETLFVAREIVEGMTGVIGVATATEMKGRTLDTLKVDWDSYLN